MNSANTNKNATRSAKRKINQPNKSNNFTKKIRYNTTNYTKLNGKSGIKFMKTVNVSKTNVEKAKQFYDSLQDIPMYVIWGHSCVCPNEEECYGEMPKRTEFAIPTDTYLVNLSQPGDFFCGDIKTIAENQTNIRSYLSLHGEGDIYGFHSIGQNMYSMFSGIQRATSPMGDTFQEPVIYPNVSFILNAVDQKTTRTENECGVYTMPFFGKPNNSMSILPQDYKRNNWFLEDIVQEVYEKTNVRKGIFILAGCLERCYQKMKMDELNRAAELMHIANVRYPTLRETFTYDELKEHSIYNPMFDFGVKNPTATISPKEIQYMTKQCLTCPKRIIEKLPQVLHANNYEVVKSMANKMKKKHNKGM